MKVRKVLYSISDLFIQEFWYKNWVRTSLRPVSAKILKSPCPTLTESFFQPKINNCVRTTFKLPKYILSSHFLFQNSFIHKPYELRKWYYLLSLIFTSCSGKPVLNSCEKKMLRAGPFGAPPLGLVVLCSYGFITSVTDHTKQDHT